VTSPWGGSVVRAAAAHAGAHSISNFLFPAREAEMTDTAGTGGDGVGELVHRVARSTVALNYRRWNWGEGVAQYALLRTGILLNEPAYTGEVSAFMRQNAALVPRTIDEIMPALAAVLLHQETGDKLPLELALRVAAMLETHPRSHHGAYTATRVRTVWVDYLFESAPYLWQLGAVTGDPRYAEWAIDQTLAYLMACWNPRERLFHHVYYDATYSPNPSLWARANGWTALGLVEMLALIPRDRGLTPMLSRVLGYLAERLAALQDESGHWHIVLDDPATYLETSTSAMISLALRRAVRDGWVDQRYRASADRAWDAVVREIDANGQVLGVSAETPPGDAEYYQAIERGVYPWGQGFALLAALDRLEFPAA
jgi:unsaturated rhamnogalacturonyl hydrolase